MKHELPLVIEPEQLAAQLEHKDVRVIDLSPTPDYHNGHIPGAIALSSQLLLAGIPPAPGKLPSTAQLEEVFGDLGLKPEQHIVACDNEGGGWAGRLLWTLEVIGHKKYSYLNGGMRAWRGAGLPLSTKVSAPESSEIEISIDSASSITVEELQQRLGDDSLLVWDARSPAEYYGERVLAMKGGHIPGAVNCDWLRLMDPARELRIRSDAREFLANLGIDGSREIVTHCQAHHRSAFTWLVGKSLGFSIRAYPGSWSEWGNLPDTPVER